MMWLKKKRAHRPFKWMDAFQKKYCILDVMSNTFQYGENQSKKKKLISLDDVLKIEVTIQGRDPVCDYDYPYSFKLFTKKRMYYLAAVGEDERQEFIDGFTTYFTQKFRDQDIDLSHFVVFRGKKTKYQQNPYENNVDDQCNSRAPRSYSQARTIEQEQKVERLRQDIEQKRSSIVQVAQQYGNQFEDAQSRQQRNRRSSSIQQSTYQTMHVKQRMEELQKEQELVKEQIQRQKINMFQTESMQTGPVKIMQQVDSNEQDSNPSDDTQIASLPKKKILKRKTNKERNSKSQKEENNQKDQEEKKHTELFKRLDIVYGRRSVNKPARVCANQDYDWKSQPKQTHQSRI